MSNDKLFENKKSSHLLTLGGHPVGDGYLDASGSISIALRLGVALNWRNDELPLKLAKIDTKQPREKKVRARNNKKGKRKK